MPASAIRAAMSASPNAVLRVTQAANADGTQAANANVEVATVRWTATRYFHPDAVQGIEPAARAVIVGTGREVARLCLHAVWIPGQATAAATATMVRR